MDANLPAKQPKKIGRPKTKPPADAAERIRQLAKEGNKAIGIARSLGVCKQLFARWLTDHPELAEALEEGKDEGRLKLHSFLVTEAVEKKNITAAIFLLKAYFGYREGDQVDVGGKVQVNIALPGAMSLQQFTAMQGGAPGIPQKEPINGQ